MVFRTGALPGSAKRRPIETDEARALGPGDRLECGPADSAAPKRGCFSTGHHWWRVFHFFQKNGVEVLLQVQTQTVEDIAREQNEPGTRRAEDDALTFQIRDRPVRRVGAHGKHACARVHGCDHRQLRGRPPDPRQCFVGSRAFDQTEIELAFFEQRDVFLAAAVCRACVQGGIGLKQRLGERLAVNCETPARGCGAEDQPRRFRAGRRRTEITDPRMSSVTRTRCIEGIYTTTDGCCRRGETGLGTLYSGLSSVVL